MTNLRPITISNYVDMQIEIVWKAWIKPVHIKNWNNATSDWYTPYAKNDFKIS